MIQSFKDYTTVESLDGDNNTVTIMFAVIESFKDSVTVES